MDAPMEDNSDYSPDTPPDPKQIEAQKLINEEYKIWKKNSPFLYDLLYARALEWPTLTMQWFPDKKEIPGSNLYEHRLLYGTQTSGPNAAKDAVCIAKIEMPDFGPIDPEKYDAQSGELGGYGTAKQPFEFQVIQQMPHDGDVNKARYLPQNPDLIATMSSSGKAVILDRTKHSLKPGDNFTPQMLLTGHTDEGFGLSWSPHKEGLLATGAQDSTICLYDLNGFNSENRLDYKPTSIYKQHSATVNDVQFHPEGAQILGSVSDDLTVQIWDLRQPPEKPAFRKVDAHTDAVNCIAFHPTWNSVLATGSADKTIALWDMRNGMKKLHSMEVHKEAVIKLEWHPFCAAILASASYDRRLCIEDLSKIGEEQTPEEAEDGPPELLFMHGGFTNRISDFNWNPHDPWMIAAAAEDNQAQIFRPARTIVEDLGDRDPTKMKDVEEPVASMGNTESKGQAKAEEVEEEAAVEVAMEDVIEDAAVEDTKEAEVKESPIPEPAPEPVEEAAPEPTVEAPAEPTPPAVEEKPSEPTPDKTAESTPTRTYKKGHKPSLSRASNSEVEKLGSWHFW